MNAANGTTLRPLTPIEEKAVELSQRGVPEYAITLQTRLSAEQITVALERHAEWQQLSNGAKPPRAYVKRDAPARVELELNPPPAAETEPPRKLPTAALLAWAEQHGPSRAKTLAARIRESLVELRVLHSNDTARAEAAAEVERLTAELEAAKANLREVSGKTTAKSTPRSTAALSDAPDRAERDAIRAWAKANDVPCASVGSISSVTVAAYRAAIGGSA